MVEIDPKQAEQSALEAAQKRLKSMEQRLLALELRKPPASLQENELFSSGGWTFRPRAASGAYASVFELYDVTATTVKIRDGKLFLGGALVDVTGTASDITVSEDAFVVIEFTRSGTPSASISLIDVTTPPAGTDSIEYFSLYYIPFADGAITTSGIIDWRMAPHVTLFQ